jgi:hypothetical protein
MRSMGFMSLLGLALSCGCVSRIANNQPAPAEPIFRQAAAVASAPLDGIGWESLFDGRTLNGWQVTDYGGHAAVHCEGGLMVFEPGDALTGVNWTNKYPKVNYEVALDAMRVDGSDFFCGLTFPVKDSFCTLILGGWGGKMTGLSSIDGNDASENETSQLINFEANRWYRVRVRVTEGKIEAWLDADKIVDLPTANRTIGLRFGEIEESKPLGLTTYQTRGAMREIKLRMLDAR